jgi:hypothetical protein
MAAGLGDRSVDRAWIYATTKNAAEQATDPGGVPPSHPDPRAYVIVIRGWFVCQTCSVPPGGKLPRGRFAYDIWVPHQGVSDFGLVSHAPSGLRHLGPPHVLMLRATANKLPTVTLSHPGHLPAPTAGTFVSLIPACACSRRTNLDQFSIRNGRWLGMLGTLTRYKQPPLQASDPHPGPSGSFVLTFSSGFKCKGFELCTPVPNTCTSVIERINPAGGSVTTILDARRSVTYTDAVPSPDGRQLALIGGPCRPAGTYVTVRDLATGREWTLGADVQRCTGVGPAVAWNTDGTKLLFPYAPETGRPPRNPNFCVGARLPGLVIAAAHRTSSSRTWKVIHADRRCGFLYGVFDPQGIAAVEGCDYGRPARSGVDVFTGDAFLLQLSGPTHRVVDRVKLKLGFDGGGVVEDPRTGSVLISEYQAANNGPHPYNWVWAFAHGRLRLVHRYSEEDAPQVTAEPF